MTTIASPMLQMLREDGTALGPAPAALTPERLQEALRWMKIARVFDSRAIALQRQGKSLTYAGMHGQEAALVGSALALDPARDWMVPQYRESLALAIHGFPLARFFLYLRGHPVGGAISPDVKMLPVQISVGSQITHAAGLGWGLKLQGKDGAVLAYFGDGATSEGSFHEGLNFAGVMATPVVFFCQNNGWAISTPRSRQTASRTIAEKAIAYGFPGIQVDGNDLLAVYSATREAVERARSGDGPTLIEAVTYRLGAHTTADDPTRYVPAEELERSKQRDPIIRLTAYMTREGLLDADTEAALDDEARAHVADAYAQADAEPEPPDDGFFEHIYAHPPARLERQQAEYNAGRSPADVRNSGESRLRSLTSTKLVTAEELERLPDDGFRYDLIAGELIKQMPANFEHGALAAIIAWILLNFVKPRRLGIVVGAETVFLLARDPDHVLGPDVAFVRADRLPPHQERRRFLPLPPDLAVEVISPSDSARTVTDKVMDYLDHGVALVWVVDPVRHAVTVWTADRTARMLREGDELDGESVLPEFRTPVAAIFESSTDV